MLVKEISGGWTYDDTVEPLKPILNPTCLKRTAFWKSPGFHYVQEATARICHIQTRYQSDTLLCDLSALKVCSWKCSQYLQRRFVPPKVILVPQFVLLIIIFSLLECVYWIIYMYISQPEWMITLCTDWNKHDEDSNGISNTFFFSDSCYFDIKQLVGGIQSILYRSN